MGKIEKVDYGGRLSRMMIIENRLRQVGSVGWILPFASLRAYHTRNL